MSEKLADPVAVEKAFWSEHHAELSEGRAGKFLLIKGEGVHGVYETYDAAVDGGIALFGRGPFWVCDVNKPEPDPLVIPVLALGVPLVADPEHQSRG